MSVPACEDAAAISLRMKQLREEREPKCPNNSSITLYKCLRSITKCGTHCPYMNDWVGPETTS